MPTTNIRRPKRPAPTRASHRLQRKKQTSDGAKSGAPAVDVGAIRGSLGLKRGLFARVTGFSERALAEWEKGERLTEGSLRRMVELQRFSDRLARVVSRDAIPGWLVKPNPELDGLKPIEVIERGEIDRLWQMLFYLESGIAS
jgi:DNA-binding transcriptional regulator YiaG